MTARGASGVVFAERILPRPRSADRTLLTLVLLFAAVIVIPTHAQPLGPIDVIVDGGVVGTGAADARAGENAISDVRWFGGITAESAPLPMGRHWDFSADVALRREPTFAIARTGTGVSPAYLDALGPSLSLRFAHRSGAFEVAIVGRYGEARVDQAQRVDRARNEIGDWAFEVDARVDLQWFGSLGAQGGRISRSPMSIVHGYIGVKHDQRLHRAGDLSEFDDPTGRIMGGLFVAPWRLTNARGETMMVAGLGGDAEAALRTGQRLPSGYRVFLRADVDLGAALRGREEQVARRSRSMGR